MKPVTLKEVLPWEQYEILRQRLRPLFIAEKDRHRLAIGDHVTLLFENSRTVWYQVEEMLRTERITDEIAVRHEIDTYNELLPRPGELTATMLIEYGNGVERDRSLRALVGIERHVWIRLGARREGARFDARQMSPERVSSVQFLRFPLGGLEPAEFLSLADNGEVAIEIDHPALKLQAMVAGPLAAALSRDLSEE